MGARYYDPKGGKFLSPDPIGLPLCLDLYAYAGGDPVNYMDPDGRFQSPVYKSTGSVILRALAQDPRSLVDMAIAISSKRPERNPNYSTTYQVGSRELPNIGIGFINGINNSRDDAVKNAVRLHQYTSGLKIHAVYNATHSMVIDSVTCVASRFGVKTAPDALILNEWTHFFSTRGPDAKFLQICHSGGAEHVRNALLTAPEWMRSRIEVVAIAPSVLIPRELCHASHNCASTRDLVTHLNITGKIKYGNELHVLKPHPDAPWWDHDFLSPTFEKVLQQKISDFIKANGDKE
jgi:hypothetical protein